VSDSILIFEPESPADLATYQQFMEAELPRTPAFYAKSASAALSAPDDVTILVAKPHQLTLPIMQRFKNIKFLQALTTGTDALKRFTLPAKVLVATVRGCHGPQMSEHVFLMMLSITRDYPSILRNQSERRWGPKPQPLINGKTVVFVGVGAIAEEIAKRCQCFGMKTIGVTDRAGELENFDGLVPKQKFHNALEHADFLVLTTPLTEKTRGLIGEPEFDCLRPGCVLINVSRGEVVDEKAMANALRDNRLHAAAIDVFATEPLAPESELWELPNIVITPHIAGLSKKYAQQVWPVLRLNISAYLRGDFDQMKNTVTI
jgi:phosphoglycerate dehydrogenase-like enzyme